MLRPVVSMVVAGLLLPSISSAAPKAPGEADGFMFPAQLVERLTATLEAADRGPAARTARTLGISLRWVNDLASVFDIALVPETADQLVRARLQVRDALHAAGKLADLAISPLMTPFAELAELADRAPFRAPDVSILSTFPLPTSKTSWATSGFGWRDDPMRRRPKFHSGADVRAKPGTPVFAAGDGVVTFAGRQSGYGNLVMVDHGGGVITRYAHLRRIQTKVGAVLGAGTQLGQVGSTGRATGPHLHFEVRLDGRAVNPDTALAVGALQRDGSSSAELAAFALDPDLSRHAVSDLDPPKVRRAKKSVAKETRPERAGRTKRVKPVS